MDDPLTPWSPQWGPISFAPMAASSRINSAAIRCAEDSSYALQLRRKRTKSKCSGVFKKIYIDLLKYAKQLLRRGEVTYHLIKCHF